MAATRALEGSEIKTIFDSISGRHAERNHAMLMMGIAAALRATELVKLTTELQDKRTQHRNQKNKLRRGVHAKSHGCLKATFTVSPDLPEKFQVGLFAKPGETYDALIRYSNAAVLIEDDLERGALEG